MTLKSLRAINPVKIGNDDVPTLVDFSPRVRVERRSMPERETVHGPDGKPVVLMTHDPSNGKLIPMRDPTGAPVHLTRQIEKDGQPLYKWIMYELQDTGLELHEEHDDAAKEHLKATFKGALDHLRDANGVIEKKNIKTLGTHPVIVDENGNPAKTTEPAIWVPVGEFEDHASAFAAANDLVAQGGGKSDTKH